MIHSPVNLEEHHIHYEYQSKTNYFHVIVQLPRDRTLAMTKDYLLLVAEDIVPAHFSIT